MLTAGGHHLMRGPVITYAWERQGCGIAIRSIPDWEFPQFLRPSAEVWPALSSQWR